MNQPNSDRVDTLKHLIHQFVDERLQAKLEKLKGADDSKRTELLEQHRPADWLRDAARRSSQLQVVTHTAKAVHPDSKASSLRCNPPQMPELTEVGSHALGDQPPLDVVGNAAALDVFKFLRLALPGQSNLLTLCRQADPDWLAALSDDPAEAMALSNQFAALEHARNSLSGHTLAKQVLWPTASDETEGWRDFHTLVPLFPSSLVHQVHQHLQHHRFGDATEPQRQAFKVGQWHAEPVHQFPHLGQQKLGGTKPQNISQLNSERGGAVPLLASLPPQWNSEHLRPPLKLDNLFDKRRGPWSWRRDVKGLVEELADFLHLQPAGQVAPSAVRAFQDELATQLVDALLLFTLELRDGLEPGWSQHPDCRLPLAQRQWLDPQTSPSDDPRSLVAHLASQFALWLSDTLRGHKLLMDAASAQHWRDLAEAVLADHAPEARHAL